MLVELYEALKDTKVRMTLGTTRPVVFTLSLGDIFKVAVRQAAARHKLEVGEAEFEPATGVMTNDAVVVMLLPEHIGLN